LKIGLDLKRREKHKISSCNITLQIRQKQQ